ncbi:hypothetical protein HYS94_00450 [Candidatus Daviesbacteria bacterium]|nr:hypothetical protein [Candidatus Daviesbacteria bacterium]
MATAISKNGILIRLTEERWKHIILMHPSLVSKQTEVLNTIKDPDYIFQGSAKELLAVSATSKRVYLVVVYKEKIDDGFIITAFETTDKLWLFKKELIWSKVS